MNRTKLDSIADLRAFAMIVDAGSLVGAARLLGLTPNAVSRRLGALETRLGQRLVNRTTRRLAVTEDGRAFHVRCKRILDELEEAERELDGADGRHGTIRIAVHPGLAGQHMMSGLRVVLEESSDLRVQVRVATGFIDPIAAGLDISVFVGNPPASSLVAVPLGVMVWGLAAASSYLERHGRPRSPTQLSSHECLRVLRQPPEDHWPLKRIGDKSPTRFPIGGRLEIAGTSALDEALNAGLGIGIRLRSSIEAGAERGQLEHVLPAWQWASTPVFALLPRGRSKLPGIRTVLDILRASIDLPRLGAHRSGQGDRLAR
ncbi:MAG: LysR family transcriptional regulator [Gammaproteobacteria bacterium]